MNGESDRRLQELITQRLAEARDSLGADIKARLEAVRSGEYLSSCEALFRTEKWVYVNQEEKKGEKKGKKKFPSPGRIVRISKRKAGQRRAKYEIEFPKGASPGSIEASELEIENVDSSLEERVIQSELDYLMRALETAPGTTVDNFVEMKRHLTQTQKPLEADIDCLSQRQGDLASRNEKAQEKIPPGETEPFFKPSDEVFVLKREGGKLVSRAGIIQVGPMRDSLGNLQKTDKGRYQYIVEVDGAARIVSENDLQLSTYHGEERAIDVKLGALGYHLSSQAGEAGKRAGDSLVNVRGDMARGMLQGLERASGILKDVQKLEKEKRSLDYLKERLKLFLEQAETGEYSADKKIRKQAEKVRKEIKKYGVPLTVLQKLGRKIKRHKKSSAAILVGLLGLGYGAHKIWGGEEEPTKPGAADEAGEEVPEQVKPPPGPSVPAPAPEAPDATTEAPEPAPPMSPPAPEAKRPRVPETSPKAPIVREGEKEEDAFKRLLGEAARIGRRDPNVGNNFPQVQEDNLQGYYKNRFLPWKREYLYWRGPSGAGALGPYFRILDELFSELRSVDHDTVVEPSPVSEGPAEPAPARTELTGDNQIRVVGNVVSTPDVHGTIHNFPIPTGATVSSSGRGRGVTIEGSSGKKVTGALVVDPDGIGHLSVEGVTYDFQKVLGDISQGRDPQKK